MVLSDLVGEKHTVNDRLGSLDVQSRVLDGNGTVEAFSKPRDGRVLANAIKARATLSEKEDSHHSSLRLNAFDPTETLVVADEQSLLHCCGRELGLSPVNWRAMIVSAGSGLAKTTIEQGGEQCNSILRLT